ncbi:MAG TPA: multiheme c-type cytochrome [Vicinamibacterales bacterium]|nr:multiheme c-type cytochrome [Vicinamibacterales bacterium]
MRNRAVILLIAASAALGISGAAARARDARATGSDGRPLQVRDDGFVSSDACQACHPSQYASWRASYHRTMTQVATAATAQTSFNNQSIDAVHGRPMILTERGPQLWAEFDDPDSPAPPGSRPRIERQVRMITGSHNQQVFWYGTGHDRLLGQLPGAYLVREQRWIPRRMAVLHPPSQAPLSETGHWNSTCIACHTTHGKPQFDTPFGSAPLETQSIQTTAAEFGIGCESCHGPGAAHVAANRSPVRRYQLHLAGSSDATIVQPLRLDAKRASQVCGQCHGVWEFYDAAGERLANSRGLPFRPGDQLTETRLVAQPTVNADSDAMRALLEDDSRFIRDAFWSDGTVRVSGREYNGLIESPCYRNATDDHRTLTCFSCHSLHRKDDDRRTLRTWADDQLSPAATDAAGGSGPSPTAGNEACLQCHEPLRANVPAHTRHAADSSGSSCYNCHMPYTTYGLLKTIRSHTIGSPSTRESLETGRPNACNLCHLDRTLAWTADALQRWYGTPLTPLTGDDRDVAASVGWLLKGDAGQRAIVSQAMAWPAAQRASGTEWMAPYLAQLLDDPYDAVRFGAARSLTALPGFSAAAIDFAAPSAVRRQAQLRVMATWDAVRGRPGQPRSELLMTPAGELDVPRVLALLKQRNNRSMLLRE